MMSSNNKTKKTNRSHSINHTIVTKDLLLESIAMNDVRNNTKAWKNKNINLRMAKESEKMLVKNRITPTGRIKERSIKITVC